MNGAGTAQKSASDDVTIRGGAARLVNRLSAMEYQLSLILDKLVPRPKPIDSGNKTAPPPVTPSVSECITDAHLTANQVEESIAAIQNLIG